MAMLCRGGVEDIRLEAKAKDSKKFRAQGQGQTFSWPWPRTKDTDAIVLQKKRSSKLFLGEKGLQKFFSGDLYLRKPKKRSLQIFRKVSGVFQRNFNGSKIVLSSSRGQGNFRGLEASRPRPRTSKCVLEDSTSDVRHQRLLWWSGSSVITKCWVLWQKQSSLWAVVDIRKRGYSSRYYSHYHPTNSNFRNF